MKNYSTEQLSRLLLTNVTSEHSGSELTKKLSEELKKRTKGEGASKKDDIQDSSKEKTSKEKSKEEKPKKDSK